MNKKQIITADFTDKNRVIAMSDIHGDLKSFQEIYKKIKFDENDVLIIVGDILEKGKQSLALLREIMKCSENNPNFYLLKGNNDTIISECLHRDTSDEDVLNYIHYVQNTILCEMAIEMNMSYETIHEVHQLREKIKENYAQEIEFLEQLPVILDCEKATFVHAGIKPIPLEEQDEEYCLCTKAFGECEYVFEKPVVVGHWPASNYGRKYIDANIYYNEKSNIYNIDGGNSMKSWQQINLLIFEKDHIYFDAYDRLPKVIALEDQSVNPDAFTLAFPNTEVTLLTQNESETECYIPYLKQTMIFKNEDIYQYKGKNYCNDFTTYDLQVNQSDILSFCEKGLFKKNGKVGRYHFAYKLLEE